MKNFRLALRSLVHFKGYTAINLLGLALCLACVIVISRYVYGELSVDRFNRELDRIYVTTQENSMNSGVVSYGGFENSGRDKYSIDLRRDPAVERSSNFILFPDEQVTWDNRLFTTDLLVADTSFLQILDYPVIHGEPGLDRPENALITEEYAQKIFGSADPLGKKLRYESSGKELTVTGVIGKTSAKSSLRFDLLIPISHTKYWSRRQNTLVLLYPDQDYRAFNRKYEDFVETGGRMSYQERLQLFPLKRAYLDRSVTDYGTFLHGNSSTVIALSVVGLLILLIGASNFVNIYMAVVLRRGREFGMKKVFGAPAGQIFGQLLLENGLMITTSLVIAFALTEILNPVVKNLLGFDQLPFRLSDFLLPLGLLLILPLLTTLFPFFHYNYASPVSSLRSVGRTGGRSSGRHLFLLFQYILTLGMIIISLFFGKQLHYMLNADPGYRTEGIIKVPFLIYGNDHGRGDNAWEENEKTMAAVRQKMDASPLFTQWAFGTLPVDPSHTFNFRHGDGELKPATIQQGDESWLKMLDIDPLEGRLFDNGIEDFYSYHLIVTESALDYYGITDVETERLQPERRWWYSMDRPAEEMETNPPYRIVGVVKDFHVSHLGVRHPPVVVMFSEGNAFEPVLAAIAPGKKQEAIGFLRQLHDEMVGGEFTYSFVEDEVKALYKEDRKVAAVYSLFTAIAILISTLGLFSMSLFDVQQRYREIAIRKVNGATTGDILRLLLKRYIYLLSLAFVIAAPLAWLVIRRYLEDFNLKAPVSGWTFAVALLLTVAVSLLTLIRQTRKAAATHPAVVIRSE